MKLSLTLIAVFIYIWGNAQSSICLTIADAKDHSILEGVTVFASTTKTGDITNHLGNVCLDITHQDNIEINHLAYTSQTLSAATFQKYQNDTLFLDKMDNPLPEITVHEVLHPIALGLTQKKNKKFGVMGALGFGDQQVMRIEIPDSIDLWQIKSFSFWVSYFPTIEISPKKTRVRLVMYNDKNGRPNESILTENIILQTKKKKWNNFDLQQYRLFFREKVIYIGLEWIANEKSNRHGYGLTIKSFRGNDAMRNSSFKKSLQIFEGWKSKVELTKMYSNNEEYIQESSYQVPGYKMEIFNIK